MSNWNEKPFIDYLNAVDDLLNQQYGITTNDCGVERTAQAQEAGETPTEFVKWIADKYDLTPLHDTGWTDAETKTKRIRDLNDRFRSRCGVSAFNPDIPGTFIMTAGIASLPPELQISIWMHVRSFNNFTDDNDPYGEHDFGSFVMEGAGKIFWKIDYYAPDKLHGSEDPSDTEQTFRVLTIMLAEEY